MIELRSRFTLRGLLTSDKASNAQNGRQAGGHQGHHFPIPSQLHNPGLLPGDGVPSMRLGSWESQDSRETFEPLKHSTLYRFHSPLTPTPPSLPSLTPHPPASCTAKCTCLPHPGAGHSEHISSFLFFWIRTSFLFIAE
uniref:Uncharacterized protein n=1 Tax=Pipistrellus kuhlii TaxID=59472 RepID=A0A7J8B185_PIPKU|nr:hypothetical protein mPipKuh1_007682 [Pipistrellus kuhlii]